MFIPDHLHNNLGSSEMSAMGSVVVDPLLMVLGLQVLGYGPQAGCQYHHHPLTVGWFLGER